MLPSTLQKLQVSTSKSSYARRPWRDVSSSYGTSRPVGLRGGVASARAQKLLAGAKEATARNAAQRGAAVTVSVATPEGIAFDVSSSVTPEQRVVDIAVAAVVVGETTPALRDWVFGNLAEGQECPPSSPSAIKKVRGMMPARHHRICLRILAFLKRRPPLLQMLRNRCLLGRSDFPSTTRLVHMREEFHCCNLSDLPISHSSKLLHRLHTAQAQPIESDLFWDARRCQQEARAMA